MRTKQIIGMKRSVASGRTSTPGGSFCRAFLFALALFACAGTSWAQLTFNYNFTTNTAVPDNGQITDTRTLNGISNFSNVVVRLNLTSPNGNDPMWLGDMYSTLTMGAGVRTAVLLNRPGLDNVNLFGSSLSALNVTLDDSITQPDGNIWGTTTGTGTYNSDGRLGVNPYAAGVAFSNGDRNNTLGALNGSAVSGNQFSLLMADTAQGGSAQLSSWGVSITGTAAGAGTTVAAGTGGTLSISDGGVATTNTLGADLTTTQSGGGALVVTLAGTTTFSGTVGGSGALQKDGAGTLILSNATGNTYTGNTTVNAGTLLANNTSNSATGTGAVTVNNTGTLGGTGFINTGANVLTVNSGGTLRGGDGTVASTLSITNTGAGAVTLNTGSIIELALGTSFAHSTLAIAGSLSFASAQIFHFLDFGATIGTYDNIITGITDPGASISTWTITNAGWTGTFLYDGTGNIDLTLTAVPEPGTWAAGILTVLALCWTQLRKSSRASGRRIFRLHKDSTIS